MHVVRSARLTHLLRIRYGPSSRYTHTATTTSHTGNPTIAVEQPTVVREDGGRTLRPRQHGKKPMPLPPFLDPLAVRAKTKYTEPKPLKPHEEKTAFQRELEANPYVQALATPVRQCAVTNARLPSHFLLPFVSHIEQPPAEDKTSSEKAESRQVTARISPDLDLNGLRELRSPARTYALAQQHIIKHIGSKRRWLALVSERMKKWFALRLGKQWHNFKVQSEWEWDNKTDENVLEKLREDVVDKVMVAWKRGQLQVVNEEHDVNAETQRSFGCYLRLDDPESGNTSGARSGANHGIPVHDLGNLLSPEHLHSIRNAIEGVRIGHGTSLAVTSSYRTVSLQLALLKLDAYERNRPR